jgi:hypothetical protein
MNDSKHLLLMMKEGTYEDRVVNPELVDGLKRIIAFVVCFIAFWK